MKDYANKVVRCHLKKEDNDLANGNSYRKLYERWDICDWEFSETFNEYKKGFVYDKETCLYYDIRWYKSSEVYTEEELYQQWYKYYKRK